MNHIDAVGTHIHEGETEEVFHAIEGLEGKYRDILEIYPPSHPTYH